MTHLSSARVTKSPRDAVELDVMWPYFSERYGNAASRSHTLGYQAKAAVEKARKQLAEALGCSPKAVVFTSGATESNSLAILHTSTRSPNSPLTTRHIILQDMLAITGGYIGAVNIPEKWFPGKCDTLCNSHHIMHVLVLVVLLVSHSAL